MKDKLLSAKACAEPPDPGLLYYTDTLFVDSVGGMIASASPARTLESHPSGSVPRRIMELSWRRAGSSSVSDSEQGRFHLGLFNMEKEDQAPTGSLVTRQLSGACPIACMLIVVPQDLLGDFVTLLCSKLSRKPPSGFYPYGLAKVRNARHISDARLDHDTRQTQTAMSDLEIRFSPSTEQDAGAALSPGRTPIRTMPAPSHRFRGKETSQPMQAPPPIRTPTATPE
ncbi:hypothetical protein L210DRAFT_3630153 [Boletus edulis BED1]|uniref:Uncharacterized protein n=1 Tax=Boletus edulis BED1 TaxID=1328754 RepID=A0AAD4BWE7_BOLED|nr:hypothetical protein L210DRAFT_3630153 [Boletus edulis BED1]